MALSTFRHVFAIILCFGLLIPQAQALNWCKVEVDYKDGETLTVEEGFRDGIDKKFFGEEIKKKHDCDFCRRHTRNSLNQVCDFKKNSDGYVYVDYNLVDADDYVIHCMKNTDKLKLIPGDCP